MYRFHHLTVSRTFLSIIIVSLALIAALSGYLAVRPATEAALGPAAVHTVVLDAGHGGEDPGKVSSSGIREKDINLRITLLVRSILEQNGIRVILTRETDCSLADPDTQKKKASDLKNRKQIITDQQPDCAVSIHQNSYPDPSQAGAQVFFHTGDEEGKRLADLIQNQIRDLTSPDHHRTSKGNDSYYLLRDNPVPTVIAEVCFLSNPSEAEMINEKNMQKKAAFAIAMGIMQYLYS